mmetsp:Transcript_31102/g.45949  ORF Transcript_31102/g.45949 Transcript_31102/m.45949 type:complete len:237 (-) Transcript_31102:807-1517(-)|eukprot:CAMPEP_0194209148 /NCGR_PEP_ID=MMETSP0156-20130528/7375_1 /TAXON_ID=33649 /ORGANISM="Thalassionema nitzschioides, Strain L26-B" /LENGTH=236 /DNA_ID=CAMNT_0038936261 /DNA_START=63 /DNA_END=773 /DNA_ORIENTATION=-
MKLFLVALFLPILTAQQQQDPMAMNGGCCLAMSGDGCVALAVDKRFGSGPQMVNVSPRHAFIPHSGLIVAFTGFHADIQSLSQELKLQVKSKITRGSLIRRRENTPPRILPSVMACLTSHTLYSKRNSPYYVEPLIVGLVESSDGSYDQPFLCALDVIGAQARSNEFVSVGVASKSMYGTAEALWRPGLSPEELVQVCGKAFLSALERDCLSGYGAVLYLITKEGIEQIELACRND